MFVAPQAPATPLLRWQGRHDHSGALALTLTNAGNVQVQGVDFQLSVPSSEQVLATQPVSAYVLPSQVRQWIIHPQQAWQGERLHVLASTNQGELAADVDVENP